MSVITLYLNHCEKQIQQLQSKLLETQQQLAVAVSTDRKKDVMIEQLDKTLAKVVEGWKKHESEKNTFMERLKEEKEKAERSSEKQREILGKFETELAEAVERLSKEQLRASKAESDRKSQMEMQSKERNETLKILENERIRVEKLESERNDAVKKNEKLEKEVDKLEKTLDEERDHWHKVECELQEKLERVAEEHFSAMEQQKKNVERESRAAEDSQKVLASVQTELEKVRMEFDTVKRDKENLKMEISLLEARHEATKAKMESEHQSEMERQIADKLADVHEKMAASESEIRESHRKQIHEINERHQEELEQQRIDTQLELAKKDTKLKVTTQEYEERLDDARREIAEFQRLKQKMEAHRSELVSKLQTLMQSHCNEALKILCTTNSSPAPSRKSTFGGLNASMLSSGLLSDMSRFTDISMFEQTDHYQTNEHKLKDQYQYQTNGQRHADQYQTSGQGQTGQYQTSGQRHADQYQSNGQGQTGQYQTSGQRQGDQYQSNGQGQTDQYQTSGQRHADQYQSNGQGQTDQYQTNGHSEYHDVHHYQRDMSSIGSENDHNYYQKDLDSGPNYDSIKGNQQQHTAGLTTIPEEHTANKDLMHITSQRPVYTHTYQEPVLSHPPQTSYQPDISQPSNTSFQPSYQSSNPPQYQDRFHVGRSVDGSESRDVSHQQRYLVPQDNITEKEHINKHEHTQIELHGPQLSQDVDNSFYPLERQDETLQTEDGWMMRENGNLHLQSFEHQTVRTGDRNEQDAKANYSIISTGPLDNTHDQYDTMSDKFLKHEDKQNELQYYIKMLLDRSPGSPLLSIDQQSDGALSEEPELLMSARSAVSETSTGSCPIKRAVRENVTLGGGSHYPMSSEPPSKLTSEFPGQPPSERATQQGRVDVLPTRDTTYQPTVAATLQRGRVETTDKPKYEPSQSQVLFQSPTKDVRNTADNEVQAQGVLTPMQVAEISRLLEVYKRQENTAPTSSHPSTNQNNDLPKASEFLHYLREVPQLKNQQQQKAELKQQPGVPKARRNISNQMGQKGKPQQQQQQQQQQQVNKQSQAIRQQTLRPQQPSVQPCPHGRGPVIKNNQSQKDKKMIGHGVRKVSRPVSAWK
ncbi:uncharacterized protein LOC144442630 [Glandiceps talaboti]